MTIRGCGECSPYMEICCASAESGMAQRADKYGIQEQSNRRHVAKRFWGLLVDFCLPFTARPPVDWYRTMPFLDWTGGLA
jgi:hypothetical protein